MNPEKELGIDRPLHPQLRRLPPNNNYSAASNALFSFFAKPIRNTQPAAEFNILDAYHYIINNYAKEETETLRQIKDPAKARQYKAENFAYCCFCGTFYTRANSGLLKPSGFICLDLDHIDQPEKLKQILRYDPELETELLFISPSGHGLKWVVDIPDDTHHFDFFPAVSNYIHHTYGLQVDPSGKDLGRACFLSHDTEAVLSEQIISDFEDAQEKENLRYREMVAQSPYGKR